MGLWGQFCSPSHSVLADTQAGKGASSRCGKTGGNILGRRGHCKEKGAALLLFLRGRSHGWAGRCPLRGLKNEELLSFSHPWDRALVCQSLPKLSYGKEEMWEGENRAYDIAGVEPGSK